MILGSHVSASTGLLGAIKEAEFLECDAFQLFTSSPRSWAFKTKNDTEIAAFVSYRNRKNIKYIFGHSIYLINLASKNEFIYNNSINSLISSCILANKIKINGVITHIGSYRNLSFKDGIKKVINALSQILTISGENTPIILETDAGSGNRIGCKFSDIGLIIKNLKSKKIKVCLDTCHVFASGYDISSQKGLAQTLEQFDKEIGIENLVVVHLNDSKGELGSRIDRHEVIGNGKIGIEGFRNIVNHPLLKNLPGIIETPDLKSHVDEIISLKRLRDLNE